MRDSQYSDRRRLHVVMVTVGLAVAVAAFVAASAVQGPPEGARRDGAAALDGFALFTALDTNSDQILSGAEIESAAATLRGRDRNGDGRLTGDELPAAGRGGRFGRGGPGGEGRGGRGRGDEPGEAQPPAGDELVETLMAFDRNADGKLTRDEVPERMQGIFDRADADKNGQLTPDEIRKSVAAQEQPANEAPGGRGGRGGRGGDFGGPGRGAFGRDALSSALDPNSDGALDAGEVAGAAAAIRALDRNQDGAVALDELFGGRGGRGGRGGFGGRGGQLRRPAGVSV